MDKLTQPPTGTNQEALAGHNQEAIAGRTHRAQPIGGLQAQVLDRTEVARHKSEQISLPQFSNEQWLSWCQEQNSLAMQHGYTYGQSVVETNIDNLPTLMAFVNWSIQNNPLLKSITFADSSQQESLRESQVPSPS